MAHGRVGVSSVGSWYHHSGAAMCWQAVVRTQGFHELSDVVLAQVLRSDRLAVDELDLVQAVREWAHVSSVSATWQRWWRDGERGPGWSCRIETCRGTRTPPPTQAGNTGNPVPEPR